MPIIQPLIHPVFAERIQAFASDALATPADSATRTMSLARSPGDSVSGSDAPSSTAIGGRLTTDSAPVNADGAALVMRYQRGATDSAPAADGSARVGEYGRAIEDALAHSDAATIALVVDRDLVDHAAVLDAPATSASLSRTIADSVSGLADTARAVRRVAVATFDAAPVGGDAAAYHLTQRRHPVDRTWTFDRALRVVHLGRVAADAVHGTDLAGKHRLLPRTAADAAPAAGSAIRSVAHPRRPSDQARAADATARVVHLARSVAQAAPAADGASSWARHPRAASDAAAAGDLVSAPTIPFVPYGPPRVVSLDLDTSRVAADGAATLTVTFDQPVVAWSARVRSTSHLDGDEADRWSGTATASGTATVPAAVLREGGNTVSAYGRSAAGLWTP